MIKVVDIRKVDDGFMLRWDNPDRLSEGAYVHMTAAWAEDFWKHQFKPYGIVDGNMNQLRYGLARGTLDVDTASRLFVVAFQTAQLNGSARRTTSREPSPFDEFITAKGNS